MNEIVRIINSDGTESNINVIMSFKVEETGKQYVIYKKYEEQVSENEMDTIYASLLVESNGEYVLNDIPDEEWSFVKKVMGNIVNSKED